MGLLCPVTPEQVKVFEKSKTSKTELPELLTDPIAMLDRGYIGPAAPKTCSTIHQHTTLKYAARKGMNITDETWQKMHTSKVNEQE